MGEAARWRYFECVNYLTLQTPHGLNEGGVEELAITSLRVPNVSVNSKWCVGDEATATDIFLDTQFPCGRVKRFLKNNTQNKMRVGAKGTSPALSAQHESLLLPKFHPLSRKKFVAPR